MAATTSSRERLRRLGQVDLGAWVEVATGKQLWSIQKRIATALSQPHAQVAVPSCNSSGKTHLAGRLALGFYDAFQPGTHCDSCGGPCRGSIVITLSSKEEHLKDNLWGEIRRTYPVIAKRHGMDGQLPPKDIRFDHLPNHFIMGQTSTTEAGVQGYHAAHILIVADEAVAVSPEVARGITGLMASGDARLLIIFNPSDDTTWAYQQSVSTLTTTIKITAFDTPHFTGEEVPDGADLIHPGFLEKLKAEGMGPGTYEWTTRVEANFWTLGEDKLVAEEWYDAAVSTNLWVPGTSAIGIDLAPYGTSENIISVRNGNSLREIRAFPHMRTDHFFQGPVTKAVRELQPHYVIYDADGVGAGAIGYAEALYKHLPKGSQVIGFRGAKKVVDAYTNQRSGWYWNLRRLFESGGIHINMKDDKLREQITNILYSIRNGAIRLETKDEMRKRGMVSPDRADGLMYAFALSDDLPIPEAKPDPQWVAESQGVIDHSDEGMWQRHIERMRDGPGEQVHPILDVADW